MRFASNASLGCLNADCCLHFALMCFGGPNFIYGMMERGEIRDRLGIKGNDCEDFVTSAVCPTCVLIQHDNEVKLRMARLPPVTQGYESHKEAMHMPAPPDGKLVTA